MNWAVSLKLRFIIITNQMVLIDGRSFIDLLTDLPSRDTLVMSYSSFLGVLLTIQYIQVHLCCRELIVSLGRWKEKFRDSSIHRHSLPSTNLILLTNA